jgi:hypothetical protein
MDMFMLLNSIHPTRCSAIPHTTNTVYHLGLNVSVEKLARWHSFLFCKYRFQISVRRPVRLQGFMFFSLNANAWIFH